MCFRLQTAERLLLLLLSAVGNVFAYYQSLSVAESIMEEYTPDAIVNRDEPVPVISVGKQRDEARDSKPSAGHQRSTSGAGRSLQDKLFAKYALTGSSRVSGLYGLRSLTSCNKTLATSDPGRRCQRRLSGRGRQAAYRPQKAGLQSAPDG